MPLELTLLLMWWRGINNSFYSSRSRLRPTQWTRSYLTLRDTLLQLCMELHRLDGPNEVIRVDPTPGLRAIREDKTLDHFRISIEVGRVKNLTKNPVAEKAAGELENELLEQKPGGVPVSPFSLSIALARLNSRIHSTFRFISKWNAHTTNDQLPITDKDLITQKHNNYCKLRGIYRSNMHSARLVIIRINAHRRPLSCSVGLLDVCLLEGFIINWTSRVNDQLIIIIGNIEPDVINTL